VVETIGAICFALLALSGALCFGRVLAGPSLADRILALDCLLIIVVVGVGVDAAVTGRGIYLDVLLVVALVAFIGTTAVARYLERRGDA
jgi:multicomponent Na+:H+ antiporter subunit F